jgi:hypothetical protein
MNSARRDRPALRLRRAAVWLSAALPAACSGGNRTGGSAVTPPTTELRAAVPATGGAADALALALLLASGTPVQHGGRPTFQAVDAELEQRAWFHGHAHVEAAGLGAGAGASVAGSELMRRLAAEPDAPADADGDGSNLDETAAREAAALAALAGAAPRPGAFGTVLPWRGATADLAASGFLDRRADALLRTKRSSLGAQEVDLGEAGAAMSARLHAAARLLETSRGSRPGGSPDDGLLGLALLQQVLGAEETLLRRLFTDGGPLGELRNPQSYDPPSRGDASWLPAAVRVVLDGAVDGAPSAYGVLDGASGLAALAALLEAAAELAWLASDRNPIPALRDVLQGSPFGQPPGRRRGRGTGGLTGGADEVTFSRDIGPILVAKCIFCHNDQVNTNGYTMGRLAGNVWVAEYEKVLAGGIVGARGNPPNVRVGDHQNSLLWQVCAGTTQLVRRMPDGCGQALPCLTSGQLSLLADWIDQGALRDPTLPPPPPKLGEDLARVLLKNMRLLHQDAALTGALHHRWDGDEQSGFVRARDTGLALAALATSAMAVPDLRDARALLAPAAHFARDRLVGTDGVAVRELDLRAPGAVPATAGVVDQAAIALGLLAAGRVLADPSVLERGRAAAAVLGASFDATARVFRTAGEAHARYAADDVAILLRALQEAAAEGVPGAAAAHDAFAGRLLQVVVAAEWEGRGEVLGDGVADTDGNGISEPLLAGGELGRAPLLMPEVMFGALPAPADGPVSWSREVRPLFRAACGDCHVDGANRGAYTADTIAQAATPGESRWPVPLVLPGDPEGSLLYRKLADRTPPVGLQMPYLRPPLDERGRQLVRRWILEGARDR